MVKDARYTNILSGTVQAAIANGVLDAVRGGDIPKEKANDLGIIYSVWLDPSIFKLDTCRLGHCLVRGFPDNVGREGGPAFAVGPCVT